MEQCRSSSVNSIMSYTDFLQSKLKGQPCQSFSHEDYPTKCSSELDSISVVDLKAELAKAEGILRRLKQNYRIDPTEKPNRGTDSRALKELQDECNRQKRLIEEMTINSSILNEKHQKESKASESIINERTKKLEELIGILKKEIDMNKELRSHCEKYEAMVQSMMAERDKPQPRSEQKQNETELKKENRLLKADSMEKDRVIKEMTEEMNAKEEIFSEIAAMKEEVIGYSDKLGSMTKEISVRDELIAKLQSNQPKQQQPQNGSAMDYKEKYEAEVIKVEKMRKSFEQLKEAVDAMEKSRDELKNNYEALLKEKNQLINMNKVLMSKMQGLGELEQKFKELFNEIIALKTENEALKQGKLFKSQQPPDCSIQKDKEQIPIEANLQQDDQSEAVISEDLNLYAIYQSSLLCFNISKKQYSLVNPKGMKSFLALYQAKGSLYYNTLQGIFILTGKSYNELLYYSQKTDCINKLLSFTDNHQSGALLLNEETKQVIVISGQQTKAVERLAIDQGKVTQLPPLTHSRINASCCFISSVLYVFFGFCPEMNKFALSIEYLVNDSGETAGKWLSADIASKEDYALMNHSVLGLTEKQVLILGGVNGNNKHNDSIVFYDSDTNHIEKIPIAAVRKDESHAHSLFNMNPVFKDYCYDNTLAFANIDDSFNVHLLNSSLEHDIIKFNPLSIQS